VKLFGGSFGVDIEESGLVFNLQGSALRNPEVSDLELELEFATTDHNERLNNHRCALDRIVPLFGFGFEGDNFEGKPERK
jgi:hypothetical protein